MTDEQYDALCDLFPGCIVNVIQDGDNLMILVAPED
jgi:hypothetical protein